jgi:hypothetical protein
VSWLAFVLQSCLSLPPIQSFPILPSRVVSMQTQSHYHTSVAPITYLIALFVWNSRHPPILMGHPLRDISASSRFPTSTEDIPYTSLNAHTVVSAISLSGRYSSFKICAI